MKKIRITYSWHETRKSSDAEQHTSSFAVELEDEVFADCIGQRVPYSFTWTKTRRQYHIAELAYWHAAMHDRYILRDDKIIGIESEDARFQTFSPD